MNNYTIFSEAFEVLAQLEKAISNISKDDYTRPIPALSNATIGQHVRHILEHFQKLTESYSSGTIDYASRLRNENLETNNLVAIEAISKIIAILEKDNKLMLLKAHRVSIEKTNTFYLREVIYNIEHCIHHQAIIKIGLFYLNIEISDLTFGVAKSTLGFRENIKH